MLCCLTKKHEFFFEKDIDSGGGKGLDCHSVLGSTEFFKSYSAGEEREGSRCFLSIRERTTKARLIKPKFNRVKEIEVRPGSSDAGYR